MTVRPSTFQLLLALFLSLHLLVSGCGLRRQPDLEQVYGPLGKPPKKHPVILIPGIMGSRLNTKDSGRNVWPGGLRTLVTGRGLNTLRLPPEYEKGVQKRDNLVPGTLFHEAYGRDFYGTIIQTLEGPAGYECDPLDQLTDRSSCVLFSWDWRRDMTEAAGRLDRTIRRIRELREAPNLTVDLVGHSAGGLLARYFVRFGGKDVLGSPIAEVPHTGAGKVHRIILIGTPNYGSVYGLQRALKGILVGMTPVQPEILATLPGLYQMLPHPDRGWMINPHGERVERDLYDIQTWRRYGWSLFDRRVRQRVRSRFSNENKGRRYLAQLEDFARVTLRRAKRFHRALSTRVDSAPARFIVFGSACRLTPARCLVERVNGELKVRLFPHQVKNRIPGVDYERLMLEPGDGSVTRASLLARESLNPTGKNRGDFPIDYTVFVCESHEKLASNITFRENLLNILLSP